MNPGRRARGFPRLLGHGYLELLAFVTPLG